MEVEMAGGALALFGGALPLALGFAIIGGQIGLGLVGLGYAVRYRYWHKPGIWPDPRIEFIR